MQNGKIKVKQIMHVCLCVRDLQRSVQFYRDLLGMDVEPADPPSERVQQCLVRGGDGIGDFGMVLKQGHPSGIEPRGIDHIGFEVPALADVFEVYCLALQLGAQATEPRRYDGHWQTFIFDPDGYKIEVLTNESSDETAAMDALALEQDVCATVPL